MTAVVRDLYIEQGATFQLGFNRYHESDPPTTPPTQGLAYDLTGCTARMQIRPYVTAPTPLIEATTENGKITLGTTNGRVDIRLLDTDTDLLTVDSAVYDLEIIWPVAITTPPTEPMVSRWLQGAVTISANVTRT